MTIRTKIDESQIRDFQLIVDRDIIKKTKHSVTYSAWKVELSVYTENDSNGYYETSLPIEICHNLDMSKLNPDVLDMLCSLIEQYEDDDRKEIIKKYFHSRKDLKNIYIYYKLSR